VLARTLRDATSGRAELVAASEPPPPSAKGKALLPLTKG